VRRRLVIAAFLAAIALAFGCSLVTSLDGLSGAPPAGAEGGGPEAEAAIDGSSDDGSSDDALPAKEAGRFCERLTTAAAFCSDFDVPPYTFGWDNQVLVRAEAGLDDAAVVSAPFALAVRSMAGDGAAPSVATLDRAHMPPAAAELHLAFDLYVDGYDPANANVVVTSIELRDTQGRTAYIALSMRTSVMFISVFDANPTGSTATGSGAFAASPPPPSKWVRVRLDVTWTPQGDGMTGTVSAAIDDDVARGLTGPIHVGVTNPLPHLFIGVNQMKEATSGYALHVDNVTFDAH
jgi:hypothetical protein